MCSSYSWLAVEKVHEELSIPTGSLNEHHLLWLVFSAHILQVILSIDCDESFDESQGMASSDESIDRIRQMIWNSLNIPVPPLKPVNYETEFRHRLTPFLRCAALYFNALTLISAPESLKDPGIDPWQSLCRYLDLPYNVSVLLDSLDHDMLKRYKKSIDHLLTGRPYIFINKSFSKFCPAQPKLSRNQEKKIYRSFSILSAV